MVTGVNKLQPLSMETNVHNSFFTVYSFYTKIQRKHEDYDNV